MPHMLLFHVKTLLRTTYFVQLVVTSTLSILAIQLLAAHATEGSAQTAWIRAGFVGMWSLTTVAAGIVGFQRFQGTLVYLALSPRHPAAVFFPLVAVTSVVGLGAFPLAALFSMTTGVTPTVESPLLFVSGIAVFWLACFSLACVIASLFVLTPNAITYEGLLVVPLILLSGVFGSPGDVHGLLGALSYLLPTSGAVNVVVNGASPALLIQALAAAAAWLLAGAVLFRRLSAKACHEGSLEVL